MRTRSPALFLAPALILAFAGRVFASEESDILFRLTPPDAGATLLVEDLRSHVSRFFDSALGQGLCNLPAVKAWRTSDQFKGYQSARKNIEKAIGEDITSIRDDLLGDAFVLALHLAPDQAPDQARGILLTRIRNRPLLDRLLDVFNSAQIGKGEIARVETKQWHGAIYSLRIYHDPKRPTECYTTLDRTFAWSNSEELIRGAIERHAGDRAGLSEEPKFQAIRAKLPGKAAVALFLDPAFTRRVMATAPRTRDRRIASWFDRYLAAVEYAGASLEWRDGIMLQTEESLNVAKLDAALRAWAAEPKAPQSQPLRVPSSTLAIASVSLNFPAFFELIENSMPDDARRKSQNLFEVLKGVSLGRDVRTEILPHLGPGLMAFVEAPRSPSPERGLPFAVSLEIQGEEHVGAALTNALRTMLAVYALDDKHGNGQLKLADPVVDEIRVTTLKPSTPFAFTLHGGRLTLGSSPEAVRRACAPVGHSELEALQTTHFPTARSFACVDLAAVHAAALAHQDLLVKRLSARNHRPEATEARDLDQVLALISLFRAAYVTSEIAPDASSIHRTIGFITP